MWTQFSKLGMCFQEMKTSYTLPFKWHFRPYEFAPLFDMQLRSTCKTDTVHAIIPLKRALSKKMLQIGFLAIYQDCKWSKKRPQDVFRS